jgi:hypothetical protein
MILALASNEQQNETEWVNQREKKPEKSKTDVK